MWWMWILGPLVAALVFLLTDWRDKRRDAELERWRQRMTMPPGTRKEAVGYRETKDVPRPQTPAPKRFSGDLPGPLARLLLAAGGGQKINHYTLVKDLAYLGVMGGDATAGSDHQTIVAKLDEAAPTLTVRPLPILDGQREPNTGVQFKKDEEFMEAFIVDRGVEGSDAAPAPPSEPVDKAIRKWLSPPVRAALLELPDVWLRVEGKSMALTLYGPIDADRMIELVTTADVIFAEYGAEGGPSLFGDEEEEAEAAPPEPVTLGGAPPNPPARPVPPPKAKKKTTGGAKKPAAGKSA